MARWGTEQSKGFCLTQDTTNTEKTRIYPCYMSDSNPWSVFTQ